MGHKPVAASSLPRVWVLGCCKLTTTLFLFLELGGVEEEAPAVPLDYTSVTMRATRKPLAACSATKYSQSLLTVASSVVSNTFRFHLDNPSSLS
jgi:hypothetical protein